MVYSDESKLNLDGSDGLMWCRRPKGVDQLAQRNISERVRRGLGSGKVNVWGCITPEGVGQLHRIEGNMNSAQYIEILENALLPTISDHGYNVRHWIFQQDNDSKHTSHMAQNWLSNHNIYTLMWPPNSPDLSPIENAWDYLEKQVKKREVQAQNSEQLWVALKEEWNQPSFSEYIRKLYESVPSRMGKLIEAKGLWTKY